jgi:uncharacterized protein (TIGR01777 family)
VNGRVVIAGGTGFIGQALTAFFTANGYEVIVLTRSASEKRGPVNHQHWDGRSLGDWAKLIDDAKGVINLAGKNINCRHTPENRRAILESRVDSVRALGAAIAECARPPSVFVQASGVGIYPGSREMLCDENASHGTQFEAQVCEAWEAAFAAVNAPVMRKVVLRLAVVLGRNGGFLRVLGRLTRLFLGGHVGDGGQFVSWVHLADISTMFRWAIERDDISGVFNACSPNPVTNAELMREMRRALHRPWSPPVPVLATRLGARLIGTEASLALSSHRCTPRRFLDKKFQFQFPQLRAALADIYQKP